MKNITKTVFLGSLSLLFILPTLAKVKTTSMYIFGVATSLIDSSTYITSIQHLDTAYLDTKTKFLGGRGEYSIQLQTYLEQTTGKANLVTSIFFNEKHKKLQKEWEHVRNKALRDTMLVVKPIIQEPVFTTTTWMKPVEEIPVKEKSSKKKKRASIQEESSEVQP